jgi:hypothetical protein
MTEALVWLLVVAGGMALSAASMVYLVKQADRQRRLSDQGALGSASLTDAAIQLGLQCKPLGLGLHGSYGGTPVELLVERPLYDTSGQKTFRVKAEVSVPRGLTLHNKALFPSPERCESFRSGDDALDAAMHMVGNPAELVARLGRDDRTFLTHAGELGLALVAGCIQTERFGETSDLDALAKLLDGAVEFAQRMQLDMTVQERLLALLNDRHESTALRVHALALLESTPPGLLDTLADDRSARLRAWCTRNGPMSRPCWPWRATSPHRARRVWTPSAMPRSWVPSRAAAPSRSCSNSWIPSTQTERSRC